MDTVTQTVLATLVAESTDERDLDWYTFQPLGTAGAEWQLTVPVSCVSGVPATVGQTVTLEWRRNDEAAGVRCGYQQVVVHWPGEATIVETAADV